MNLATKDELPPVEQLIDKIKSYNPKTNEDLVRKAYAFGRDAHLGQYRKSGEPYFTHPFAVAELLTEIRIDDATIITALLHDTVEDTPVAHADIVENFGQQVADLVNGVTKLNSIELRDARSAEVENLRKLLLAISRDVRVMLVKLADRLHNMRTIKAMSPEKQQRKARETMDIYAPLAGRMGMQYLREELEDLSFQVLNPTARASILRKFINLRGESSEVLNKIKGDISMALDKHGVVATVTGREKRPYAIWRKIQQKGEGFERLSDIYGFRIITSNLDDCYRALGAVHERYSAIPGRFKDYISQPKPNGYRSIHTTVAGRDGKRVEIQIRTQKMHFVAESGIAAHWAYKDGHRVENPYVVDPQAWFDALNEGLDENAGDEEFLEKFKMELYVDQVFAFTPKGMLVQLPRGSNPIDFAYAIHTNLGDKTVGAYIDGKRAALTTPIRNGQTVKIISVDGAYPNPNWIKAVKTSRARTAIRRSFKLRKRANDISLGEEIARVAFEQIGKPYTPKAMTAAAKALEIGDRHDLLLALAQSEITSREMIEALYPELARKVKSRPPAIVLQPLVGGAPAYASRPADCCMPIPEERIVGIAKKGEGLVYHAIDCACLARFDSDDEAEWIDLQWPREREGALYATRVDVDMANDAGVLGRVCTIAGESNANIEQLDFIDKRPDFYRVRFELAVRDRDHLQNIITAISTDPAVSEVERFRAEPANGATQEGA